LIWSCHKTHAAAALHPVVPNPKEAQQSEWKLACKRELDGADCFTFEEFGVGSEAEGFQQLGLHLF
jgi:hypothetical protein